MKIWSFTTLQHFHKDEVVLRQGEEDRRLYIVTEGTLEVLITDEKKRLKRISLIETGTVFGEQAFLDGKPRSASIRAISDGAFRILSVPAFEQLAIQEPQLALSFVMGLGRILSLRLRKTTSVLSNMK